MVSLAKTIYERTHVTRKGKCDSYATVTHTVYGLPGATALMEFLQRPSFTVLQGVDLWTPWTPGEPRQAVSEYRSFGSHSRWNTSNDIKKNTREYFAIHCPGGLVETKVLVHFEHPVQCDKHNNCCNTPEHRDSKEADRLCWCSQNLVLA